MRRALPCWIVLLALAPAAAPSAARADGDFADEKVARAIELGKKHLLSLQQPNGSFKGPHNAVGITAMCTYALLECGMSVQSPQMKKALLWLSEQDCKHTYSLGLRCQAFLAAEKQPGGKGRYRQFLARDAKVMWETGIKNKGRYSYSTPGGGGDNSNSQYGLLGVWAAAELGGRIEIPVKFWDLAAKHWMNTQGPDGGWGYGGKPGAGAGKATMTVAGLASLFVCYEQLTVKSFIHCRGPSSVEQIEKGLAWMEHYYLEILSGKLVADAARQAEAERIQAEIEELRKILPQMPAGERQAIIQADQRRLLWERKKAEMFAKHGFAAPGPWTLYYLYGVERVGLASGYKYFGTADWYKLGANWIIARQKNGSWGKAYNSAFAMIFLARGRNPVLFNKLEYRGRWNNRPHDLMNLCKWLGDLFERTVNWQIINLRVPVREWHDAPVLYIAGNSTPYFTPAELAKLRRYVEEGGTILSVTECKGQAFDRGMRQAYRRMFPQYELTKAGPDHEIFTTEAMYRLEGGNRPEFWILSNGIRPLAIHTTTDLPLYWQTRRLHTNQTSFQAAANVIRYVAGRFDELRPRGASHWPEPKTRELDERVVRIARVSHPGHWNPEPLAFERFSQVLAEKHNVQVSIVGPVAATDLTVQRAPLAVISGTGELQLDEKEIKALQAYVADGGTVLFEALNSNRRFHRAAYDAVDRIVGQRPFVLTGAHKLYNLPGRTIGRFHYRRKAAMRHPTRRGPGLEAVSIDGRPAVIVSSEDLTCGLLGYQGNCVDGYRSDTAVELMRNIAYLANGYDPTGGATTKPAPEAK